jgi:hypothetical protein
MKRAPTQNNGRFCVRIILCSAFLAVLSETVFSQTVGSGTDLVSVTVRLSNPKSTATGFVVSRPATMPDGPGQFLLVTAAHVFEKAEGDEMSVIYRRRQDDGEYEFAYQSGEFRKQLGLGIIVHARIIRETIGLLP